ncbi:MAG: hypothetical protein KA015_06995, partial [Spirochaetes bacterium]|nr:hypothetical protein [Spirochaetota bacterium]
MKKVLIAFVLILTAVAVNGESFDSIETADKEIEIPSADDKFTASDLFEKNHVVGFYGNPNSKVMGVLGRFSKEKLAEMLKQKAAEYDKVNGDKGVIPAIYIVYGTCQPLGEINFVKDDVVESYIKFAYDNGFLVYIDHQIGKYKVTDAVQRILPFLKYSNVHLAIDVEWRTRRPMKEIGSISADELNAAQKTMQDYMLINNIKGKRQLVFHQFHKKMVRNITKVKSDYDPVMLVHSTSGWGKPGI